MSSRHILIIDDEENLRHMLSVMLRKQGYRTEVAVDGADGLKKLSGTAFDFILCDLRMPGTDGRTFLKQSIEQGVSAPIIMMTAYGTVDTAVSCMKEGAYDFISKPFKKDEIIIVLKKAEERERLKVENRSLRAEVSRDSNFHGIVGRNPAMLELYEQISRIGDIKTTVMVLGESGTGKELAAQAVHNCGARGKKPFVAINCGAIPENLLESELFGHVRGAFTGAVADRAGLFEQADGGTLFLDEIGEMPLPLQVKLLRVLQEGEVRRVGATASKSVDVRVISATARSLQDEIIAGRFREDLYFRLNVFTLRMPPLRERVDDIPQLVSHFVLSCSARIGREPAPQVAPEAMRRLIAYPWPGNVRELENVIERGLVLCDGSQLLETCLPLSFCSGAQLSSGTMDDNLSIKQAERAMEIDLIRKALERTGGNRTQAAKVLEISHRALLYKLKEYGLE
jgi:DNA-binding NtrC family response regulator